MVTSSMTNLAMIVQNYLNDTAFHERRQIESTQPRAESISTYQDIVQRFVLGEISLATLRDDLKILHKHGFWGGKGPGFLMEINKLVSNHLPTNPDVEADFRSILKGLTPLNIGERIERFYNLMTDEEARLISLGTSKRLCVSPGNSAFIISLLALWLLWPEEVYVYYSSLRLALAALVKAKLIPASSDLRVNARGILVRTNQEHQSAKQTLDQLGLIAPQLMNGPYWAERFFRWLTDTLAVDPGYLKTVTIFIGDVDGEEKEDEGEATSEEELGRAGVETFQDDWLQAIPEAALKQAITEIRRRVLVSETLIRHIYRALLNGHVILTGPPGTGKTELARLLPELLWRINAQGLKTAYATTLVTATSDWSTRTLISGIVPVANNEKVTYRTQYGHLTQTILMNWSLGANNTINGRVKQQAPSFVNEGAVEEFHGRWLVIDEFNRAPIDTALGEALTALSNGGALQVPVDGMYLTLPLPKDFRIIGTLNSFDRNYLNQISEALKRRFSFIEVLPPSRELSRHEQNIVLYKALERCSRFSQTITKEPDGITWPEVLYVGADNNGVYDSLWETSAIAQSFSTIFQQILWPLFEVIRIYRQIGTAQAIKLVVHMLSHCLLQQYTEISQWLEALDAALCDSIVDQLQVLLPDELDVLLWYLKLDANTFCQRYNDALARLKPRRQAAHLEALGRVVDQQDRPYITDEQIEHLLEDEDEAPQIGPASLKDIFHLGRPLSQLPHFTRRLRTFKAERGL